jgi:hypothetical protein
MEFARHDPRSYTRSGCWVVESAATAFARLPPFGLRFFEALSRDFTTIATVSCFLRWSEQPDDVYAVIDLPCGGFGIQIDPHLEYIILTDASGVAEYGDWDGDQVEPALAHVRSLTLQRPA